MRLTRAEAVKMYGENLVAQIETSEAEPTGRTMYPAFEEKAHIGKDEWATQTDKLQAYFYIDPENPDWTVDHFETLD